MRISHENPGEYSFCSSREEKGRFLRGMRTCFSIPMILLAKRKRPHKGLVRPAAPRYLRDGKMGFKDRHRQEVKRDNEVTGSRKRGRYTAGQRLRLGGAVYAEAGH